MLKVIELFAGLGSQTQALKNIGVEHEVVAISEIDKNCLISYEALHGKPNNLGDICKIERLPEADLWTYSFPCQDVSVAGKLAGIKEGTRSGLLYEVERLLKVAKDEGAAVQAGRERDRGAGPRGHLRQPVPEEAEGKVRAAEPVRLRPRGGIGDGAPSAIEELGHI